MRAITCHPVLDEVALSARYGPLHSLYTHRTIIISDDGSIVRHDGRESGLDRSKRRAQNTLQLDAEVTGVEYHPNMEHLFVTSDSQGSVCLRDERMAFGPSTHRSHQGVVLQVGHLQTRICY